MSFDSFTIDMHQLLKSKFMLVQLAFCFVLFCFVLFCVRVAKQMPFSPFQSSTTCAVGLDKVEGVGSSGPTPTDVLSARAGPPTLSMAFGSSYYVPTKGLHLRNIKLTCLYLCTFGGPAVAFTSYQT
jgi:hypothetical protein